MLIDGKAIAETIYQDLKPRIARLSFVPIVWDVLVGDDVVQEKFVRVKQRRAEAVGLQFKTTQFPVSVTTEALAREVALRSNQVDVCGVIVQLPLPHGIDTTRVLEYINASRDIDRLRFQDGVASQEAYFAPPTAGAILHILESLPVDISTKRIAVIGQGRLVGLPTASMLQERGYDFTVADARTPDIESITKNADILITGVGKAGLIIPEHVKDGVIVIDAGTSESSGSVSGDVLPEVAVKASYFTPVPGGVGPVTVAILLRNAVISAELMDKAMGG